MWQRLTSSWVSIGTVLVAVGGIVSALVVYCIAYASGDIPASRRVLGFVLMSAWSATPYLAAIWAAHRLSQHRLASVVLLVGTSGLLAFAAYIVIQATILYPHDGQSGFALVLLPLCQWLGLGFTMVVAGFASWVSNN